MNIGEYSPEANNCFSIITQVNIIENQRIDCQTFLLLGPKAPSHKMGFVVFFLSVER